jgi:hypothetical protein
MVTRVGGVEVGRALGGTRARHEVSPDQHHPQRVDAEPVELTQPVAALGVADRAEQVGGGVEDRPLSLRCRRLGRREEAGEKREREAGEEGVAAEGHSLGEPGAESEVSRSQRNQ